MKCDSRSLNTAKKLFSIQDMNSLCFKLVFVENMGQKLTGWSKSLPLSIKRVGQLFGLDSLLKRLLLIEQPSSVHSYLTSLCSSLVHINNELVNRERSFHFKHKILSLVTFRISLSMYVACPLAVCGGSIIPWSNPYIFQSLLGFYCYTGV